MSHWTTKKNQVGSYSGKKGCHTIKDQVAINATNKQIICVSECLGKMHDFALLKKDLHVHSKINICADLGYIGLEKYHSNCTLPKKSSKHHKLTELEKLRNDLISSSRIVIEHVNGELKRFKILSCRYRNKQRKHLLRFTLICAIYNLNHGF
jgi:hypothetical protein